MFVVRKSRLEGGFANCHLTQRISPTAKVFGFPSATVFTKQANSQGAFPAISHGMAHRKQERKERNNKAPIVPHDRRLP